MTDLSPGQEVTVSGMGGGPALVVQVNPRAETVRVCMASTGKERTVPLKRVTPKRESKALGMTPMVYVGNGDTSPPVITLSNPLHPLHGLRPVPKPVTLTSPAYLAYVSKHPCCVCGRTEGVVAHHWSHHGASTGKKVDDYRTIPLCDTCHMGEWHRTGTFPGMSRKASEALMLRVQRNLLLDWTATRISDGDMVDALIRAIGGTHA